MFNILFEMFPSLELLIYFEAGPDGSFVSTRACNLEVAGSNSRRAGYLTNIDRVNDLCLRRVTLSAKG